MTHLLRAIDRAGGYAFGAEGANDTVWQVAMRDSGVTMDVRDVQERWIDRREEFDEIETEWDGEEVKAELEGTRTMAERKGQETLGDKRRSSGQSALKLDPEPPLTADQYVFPGPL